MRSLSILASCLVALALGTTASAGDAPAKPNIVCILADDLGYGDVGCYGCKDTKTPAIDRLAREGVRLTNFYANAPECTPTRTALMTGRYQQRVGGLECAIGTGNVGRYDDAIRLAGQHDLGLPVSEAALVPLLKRAGYTCVGYGKWHLGYEPKFWPLEHGFDQFFGPLGGGVDYYYHTEWHGWHVLHEDGREVFRDGYMTDLITERSVGFLRSYEKPKPFFLYVPYTCPHTPLQAPGAKPDKPRVEDNWNQGTRQTYAAMVERMDQGIGKILDTLDEKDIAGNTLVVFMSDNGGTKTADNGPLSGTKGGLFEGGIRVPCIVRYPGVVPAGKVTDQATITLDFTRSFVRLAGAEPPADRPFDGIDILAKLAQGGPLVSRTLFWRQRRADRNFRAVRDGTMKYLIVHRGEDFNEYLFDLAADPAERNNLIDARPKDADRLRRLLAQWETQAKPRR